MYRAITLFAMENAFISETHFSKEGFIKNLPLIGLAFQHNPDTKNNDMYLNGRNVEEAIRSMEVSKLVSRVAEISEVRKKLVDLQKGMGKNKGVVMDGRDIGTVVFPDAELKIFLTAAPEERAKRRFLEYQKKGESIPYEVVLENVLARDYIDTTREDSPLLKAADAIEIDNTHTNKEDLFHTALQLVKDRIAGRV